MSFRQSGPLQEAPEAVKVVSIDQSEPDCSLTYSAYLAHKWASKVSNTFYTA